MGRIRVLPDAVANQIAAGEVVERPASVVKELLENSLDAGANRIRVEAESGGRRLIRIIDDGSGMLRDDALLAFERHATSKLTHVKDLNSIATLGFRGEALPSIASVSRLTLETRAVEETTGTHIEIAGGKMIACDEAALGVGTTITVRDLFFNVPARKKFLRSDQTETAHIAQLMAHYSLAHPDKTFELTHDGKDLLNVTPVGTLRERVFQVFGSNVLEDLIDIGTEEKELHMPPPYVPAGQQPEEEPDEDLRVFMLRGFVSRPQVQKLNRNSIFLFVNGRLIRDKLILHAISAAFHNLMPSASYPFALLFLDCDAREVDVNVHPSKTEVRFRHGTLVHDFVRDTIRGLLLETRPASSLPLSQFPQPVANLPFSEFTQGIENQSYTEMSAPPPMAPADHELPEYTLRAQPGPSQRFDFTGSQRVGFNDATATPATRLKINDPHSGFPQWWMADPGLVMNLGELRPIGQIHESFIIAAGRDGLWIIDQHVAHERILFEKVLAEQAAGAVLRQQLLIPLILELSAGQQIEYARIAADLDSSGFSIEPFGQRTVAVKEAPAGLDPNGIERALLEILEIPDAELRKLSVSDLRRNIAASVACRAAIKINMRLDQRKMEWLLSELSKCEYPMACPHGRPIALRYATKDILKGFHRI